MSWKIYKTQVTHLLRQKATQIVFFILITLISANFLTNVLEFRGSDVVYMYHPMKLLLLSYNRTFYNSDNALLFIQLYPILVSLPAGLYYANERKLKIDVVLEARVGRKLLQSCKLAACFTVTAIVFTIPFLIEVVLNCISFPQTATGDFMHLNALDPLYFEYVSRYFFSSLFWRSPYLYAVCGILFFGIISGLIGAFTSTFAAVIELRYQFLYLIPVFVILNGTIYVLPSSNEIANDWYHYVFLFDVWKKNGVAFGITILVVLCFTITSIVWSCRKDCLS